MATTTRTRSTPKRSTTPRRRTTTKATSTRAASAKTASTRKKASTTVSDISSRAQKAIQSVPVNRKTISIGLGALAAAAIAGVAAYLGRERIGQLATQGREKLSGATAQSRDTLKKVADDVSKLAHDRIDEARDNIHRLRGRSNGATSSESADVSVSALAS